VCLCVCVCVWLCILGFKNLEILILSVNRFVRYILFWNRYIYLQIGLANTLCSVLAVCLPV
jgi:hypothetical protein